MRVTNSDIILLRILSKVTLRIRKRNEETGGGLRR